MDFLTLKPEGFGLDISDFSLKILKLKKTRKKLRLACFGEFPLKPGIIDRGEIKNKKALIKILKESLLKVKGEKLETKYVVASLPEEKAFMQVIKMPIIEEEELESAVGFEAENYIPLPMDEVYLGFEVVEPTQDNLDHLSVLINALPKKTIDPYLEVLKEAGLKPMSLEVESQATARALIEKGVSSDRILIIDLGANRTSFVIFAGYSVRFTSSIPISGKLFSEIIAKEFKKTQDQAEKMKIKKGLGFWNQIENKGTKKQEDEKRIFQALVPVLTDLIEQIRKCLNYYYTHAGDENLKSNKKTIQEILLCGGGASLKGMPGFLSRELNLPVKLGDPWVNIFPYLSKKPLQMPSKESLKYATALGLALRGIKYD